MFVFQMADGWFNRRPPFHPAPEAFCNFSTFTRNYIYFNCCWPIVSTIAKVGEYLFRQLGNSLHLFHHILHRVAIIGVARESYGAEKPAATARRGYPNFTTKFIFFMRLSFGDTHDIGFMYTIHLVLAIFLLLEYAFSKYEQF